MYKTLLTTSLAATALAAATPVCKNNARTQPFQYPLPNGFPGSSWSPTDAYKVAHGSLPNGGLPTSIADGTATVLEVIATNELFEVAYFYDLIHNMTSCVTGYQVGDKGLETNQKFDYALRSLRTIMNQEELHAAGANGILASAGRATISPCQYMFPVSNFDDAITFAATFTDVVLGTLQAAIYGFASDGDVELAPLVGSIIGNEAEQEGWFRLKEGKVPSALPFLTASEGPFAYSALSQLVLVSGTCPNASAIAVPVYEPLAVDTTDITINTTSLEFSFSGTSVDGMSLVYINQQNVPVVETPQDVSYGNGMVTFTAPFDGSSMSGLTIAALTTSSGPFAIASDVAAATMYGPGLIELR